MHVVVLFGIAYTSCHPVNQSINDIMYLFPVVDSGNGLVMSPTICHGPVSFLD
jgi:hypothetical protein